MSAMIGAAVAGEKAARVTAFITCSVSTPLTSDSAIACDGSKWMTISGLAAPGSSSARAAAEPNPAGITAAARTLPSRTSSMAAGSAATSTATAGSALIASTMLADTADCVEVGERDRHAAGLALRIAEHRAEECGDQDRRRQRDQQRAAVGQ